MDLLLSGCCIAFSVGSIRQATAASPRSRGSASPVGNDFWGLTPYSELIERLYTIRGATGDRGAFDLALIEKICKLNNVSDDGLNDRLEQRFPDVYAKYGAETFKKTTIDVEARAEGKKGNVSVDALSFCPIRCDTPVSAAACAAASCDLDACVVGLHGRHPGLGARRVAARRGDQRFGKQQSRQSQR